MAEKELQKQVIDYLRDKGIFCFSINPPNNKFKTYGTKYFLPDIYILKNGVSIFLELKDAAYKKAHPDRQAKQSEVRREIIRNKGLAYLVTSLEEVKEIL